MFLKRTTPAEPAKARRFLVRYKARIMPDRRRRVPKGGIFRERARKTEGKTRRALAKRNAFQGQSCEPSAEISTMARYFKESKAGPPIRKTCSLNHGNESDGATNTRSPYPAPKKGNSSLPKERIGQPRQAFSGRGWNALPERRSRRLRPFSKRRRASPSAGSAQPSRAAFRRSSGFSRNVLKEKNGYAVPTRNPALLLLGAKA